MANQTFQLTIEKVDDDLGFSLPEELVQTLGVSEGDELDWAVTGPNKLTIRRKDQPLPPATPPTEA